MTTHSDFAENWSPARDADPFRGRTPHQREARLVNLGVTPRLARQAAELSPEESTRLLEDNGFEVPNP